MYPEATMFLNRIIDGDDYFRVHFIIQVLENYFY